MSTGRSPPVPSVRPLRARVSQPAPALETPPSPRRACSRPFSAVLDEVERLGLEKPCVHRSGGRRSKRAALDVDDASDVGRRRCVRTLPEIEVVIPTAADRCRKANSSRGSTGSRRSSSRSQSTAPSSASDGTTCSSVEDEYTASARNMLLPPPRLPSPSERGKFLKRIRGAILMEQQKPPQHRGPSHSMSGMVSSSRRKRHGRGSSTSSSRASCTASSMSGVSFSGRSNPVSGSEEEDIGERVGVDIIRPRIEDGSGAIVGSTTTGGRPEHHQHETTEEVLRLRPEQVQVVISSQETNHISGILDTDSDDDDDEVTDPDTDTNTDAVSISSPPTHPRPDTDSKTHDHDQYDYPSLHFASPTMLSLARRSSIASSASAGSSTSTRSRRSSFSTAELGRPSFGDAFKQEFTSPMKMRCRRGVKEYLLMPPKAHDQVSPPTHDSNSSLAFRRRSAVQTGIALGLPAVRISRGAMGHTSFSYGSYEVERFSSPSSASATQSSVSVATPTEGDEIGSSVRQPIRVKITNLVPSSSATSSESEFEDGVERSKEREDQSGIGIGIGMNVLKKRPSLTVDVRSPSRHRHTHRNRNHSHKHKHKHKKHKKHKHKKKENVHGKIKKKKWSFFQTLKKLVSPKSPSAEHGGKGKGNESPVTSLPVVCTGSDYEVVNTPFSSYEFPAPPIPEARVSSSSPRPSTSTSFGSFAFPGAGASASAGVQKPRLSVPAVRTRIVCETPMSDDDSLDSISSSNDDDYSDDDDYFGSAVRTQSILQVRRRSMSPFLAAQQGSAHWRASSKITAGIGRDRSKSAVGMVRVKKPPLARAGSFYITNSREHSPTSPKKNFSDRRQTISAGRLGWKRRRRSRDRSVVDANVNVDVNEAEDEEEETEASVVQPTESTIATIRRSSTSSSLWSRLRNPFLTFEDAALEMKYLQYLNLRTPARLLAMLGSGILLSVAAVLVASRAASLSVAPVLHTIGSIFSAFLAFVLSLLVAIAPWFKRGTRSRLRLAKAAELFSAVFLCSVFLDSLVRQVLLEENTGEFHALPLIAIWLPVVVIVRPRVLAVLYCSLMNVAMLVGAITFCHIRSEFSATILVKSIFRVIFTCAWFIVALLSYSHLNDTLRQLFLRLLELDERRSELEGIRNEMRDLLSLIFPSTVVPRVRNVVLQQSKESRLRKKKMQNSLSSYTFGATTSSPVSPKKSRYSQRRDSGGPSYCFVRQVEGAYVLEADLVGFTAWSSGVSCEDVTDTLNLLFSFYDALTDRFECEKVKSIGDALLVFRRPHDSPLVSAQLVGLLAVGIVFATKYVNHVREIDLPVRVGIACGDLSVCVLGSPTSHLRFDVFGDVVFGAMGEEKHSPRHGIAADSTFVSRLVDSFPFRDGVLRLCDELSSQLFDVESCPVILRPELRLRLWEVLRDLCECLLPQILHDSPVEELRPNPKLALSLRRTANSFATRSSPVQKCPALTLFCRSSLTPLLVLQNWEDERHCHVKLLWKPRNLTPYPIGYMLCSAVLVLCNKFASFDFADFLKARPDLFSLYAAGLLAIFSIVMLVPLFGSGGKRLIICSHVLFLLNIVIWYCMSALFLVYASIPEACFVAAVAPTALVLDYVLHISLKFVLLVTQGIVLLSVHVSVMFFLPEREGASSVVLMASGLCLLATLLALFGKESVLRVAYVSSKGVMAASSQIWREKAINERICRSVLPRHVFRTLRTNQLSSFSSVVQHGFCCFIRVCDESGEGVMVRDVHEAEILCQLFSMFDTQLDMSSAVPIKTVQSTYIFTIDAERMSSAEIHHFGNEGSVESRGLKVMLHLADSCISSVASLDNGWFAKAGISQGSFSCGVIGLSAWTFDIFGNIINLSARLSQASKPSKVAVSDENIASALSDTIALEPRGLVELKGKGMIAVSFAASKMAKPSPAAQKWLRNKVLWARSSGLRSFGCLDEAKKSRAGRRRKSARIPRRRSSLLGRRPPLRRQSSADELLHGRSAL